MRTVVVNRGSLIASAGRSPGSLSPYLAPTLAALDQAALPDGFPFVVDDDGSPLGLQSVNQYLLDAWEQRGLDLRSMRTFHVFHLARFARFLRLSRAKREAEKERQCLSAWLSVHGEPKVDLIQAERADLVAYRDARALMVEPGSVRTELSCISSFFRYAKEQEWIKVDPVPRWGVKKRNTLLPADRKKRIAKFLNVNQARSFLEHGLRADFNAVWRPAYPERDYSFGLILVTTGLRREEAGLLLDGEIPQLGDMPSSGLHHFRRVGKGGYERIVYVTAEAVHGMHLYRTVERVRIIRQAQPRLRTLRQQGALLVLDSKSGALDSMTIVRDGHPIPWASLGNEDRRIAVRILDDGTIEPLALFLARGGLPPSIKYWDELFSNARDRLWELPDAAKAAIAVAPNHITITPHTMRHTFAVRMLAALMQEGVARAGDQYFLLANPLLTVMQLLGHASVETTQDYLYAAERLDDEIPAPLRGAAARLVGYTLADPGAAVPAESGTVT